MSIDKRFFYASFSVELAVSKRIEYLENMLVKIRAEYDKMPEGCLLVAPGTRETNFRYYLRKKPSDKMGIYLKADQEKIKRKYATKKYYKELIKCIEEEIFKLKRIQDICPEDSVIAAYNNIGRGVRRLINPVNVDDETFVSMWKNEEYVGLGFDENDTSSFYSDRHERMRSKSEVLIANALNRMNIPYKYECPVLLANGQKVYPDFTILDVKIRKVKYWEHLGKMGDMSLDTG